MRPQAGVGKLKHAPPDATVKRREAAGWQAIAPAPLNLQILESPEQRRLEGTAGHADRPRWSAIGNSSYQPSALVGLRIERNFRESL